MPIFDEDEFIEKNINGDKCLNVLSLNIRYLPKHSGEIFCFLKSLKIKFDVILLTEIGSRIISLVEKLIPNYNFYYILLSPAAINDVVWVFTNLIHKRMSLLRMKSNWLSHVTV